MILRCMSEEDAKNICNWQYFDEYSIYNIGGWDNAVNNKWLIANREFRKEQFRIVCDDNGEIIGYFRFKVRANKIIIGLGMHPEKCGKGNGKKFMHFILNVPELKGKLIELEVRSFNKRAIKCYQSVGFQIIGKIEKETLIGKETFIIMRKTNI